MGWANAESKHSINALLSHLVVKTAADSPPIHLGREPLDRCASRPVRCASCPPFVGARMDIMESSTLRVYIGPSAGERGYAGITGMCVYPRMQLLWWDYVGYIWALPEGRGVCGDNRNVCTHVCSCCGGIHGVCTYLLWWGYVPTYAGYVVGYMGYVPTIQLL